MSYCKHLESSVKLKQMFEKYDATTNLWIMPYSSAREKEGMRTKETGRKGKG